LVALTGCRGEEGMYASDIADTASGQGGGSLGVGQGGAQDFGQFRQILEDGNLPGPNTLDDVGFMNEHKIELPAADCGEDVCIHGRFGTLGNMISGSDCTIALLGMNTPIDPAELERPPLNMAIVVDTSGSMDGGSLDYVRDGLDLMRTQLTDEDRITLVRFSNDSEVLAEFVGKDDPELIMAINALAPGGATNIYAGIEAGYDAVYAHADPGFQNRVILLSDGQASAGIQSPDAMLTLTETYARFGYPMTTIGMGTSFDVDLMRDLAEAGAGSFYYLENPNAVEEVFIEEVSYFLVPLAQDVSIQLDAGDAWSVAGVYGTKQVETTTDSATIEIPTLQIAHRTSVSDNEGGRRGGGGAILVELRPGFTTTDGEVGDLTLTYQEPATGDLIEQTVSITTPFDAPVSPADGYFEDDQVEKAFVALNILAGFTLAAEAALEGDFEAGLGVLIPLRINVQSWLDEHEDSDIEDDLQYVGLFIDNLRTALEAANEWTEEPGTSGGGGDTGWDDWDEGGGGGIFSNLFGWIFD